MNPPLKHLIWDWNGTLLDDMDICIEGINRLLKKRMLPALDRNRYREIFTFPIRKYYEAAGFDFQAEAFEVPAEEFILEYQGLLKQAELFPDVNKTLAYFKRLGVRQYILSAMEEMALRASLLAHGIAHYFEGIYGISDNLAVSKLERGLLLLNQHRVNPGSCLLIGDTLHDAEVADALGVKAILIGRGHQHPERLKQAGCVVRDDLLQLLNGMK